MITAEVKLEIIRNLIFNYRADNGQRKSPKAQRAFWDKILEIIDMEAEVIAYDTRGYEVLRVKK